MGGILVGSRSKGTHKPSSDFDIVFKNKDQCIKACLYLESMCVSFQYTYDRATFKINNLLPTIDIMLGYKKELL